MCHLGESHRRSRECDRGNSSTGSRNTQSRTSTVRVHYRFHPLHERELEVVCTARAAEGAVTVIDSTGRRLRIPSWMLSAEAAELRLSDQALVSVRALRNLTELLASRLSLRAGGTASDSLAPTKAVLGRGGTRGTASTGGRPRKGGGRATSSTARAGVRGKGEGDQPHDAGTSADASGARGER